MKKPLMKGLAGQYRPNSSNIKIQKIPIEKSKHYVDTSQKGVYRIESINFDVPIRRDKVMNANIKAHILDEDKMREIGFVERTFHWEYEAKVSFIPSMEEYLKVTIGKESEDVNIKVIDKFLERVYDYQSQIYDDEFQEYANRIHIKVQDEMEKLVEWGIISGYNRGDYI